MAATQPNVAELVARMPEVDRQKPNEDPKPGQQGKFTAPNPDVAEKIFLEILAGGRDSVQTLVRLVRAPGDSDFQDYKAGYVLHGLVILVGRPGKEEDRLLVSGLLAAELARDKASKSVKAFLIQELQTCGGKEVVPALAAQLAEPELCEPAARALLSIRDGAKEALRTALRDGKAAQRLTLVQALGVARDAEAAPLLKETLRDSNRELRLAAAWGLANCGEASAATALLKLAGEAEDWERSQATKACLLLAERLLAAGQKPEAIRIYTHLRDTRPDRSERHIREAADRALNTLKSSG